MPVTSSGSAQRREDLSDRLINVGRDEGTTAHAAAYLDGGATSPDGSNASLDNGRNLDNGKTGLASFPESKTSLDSPVMLCAVEEEAYPEDDKGITGY